MSQHNHNYCLIILKNHLTTKFHRNMNFLQNFNILKTFTFKLPKKYVNLIQILAMMLSWSLTSSGQLQTELEYD